jgi:hypothetical protein
MNNVTPTVRARIEGTFLMKTSIDKMRGYRTTKRNRSPSALFIALEDGSMAEILVATSEMGQTRKSALLTARSAVPLRADIASQARQV